MRGWRYTPDIHKKAGATGEMQLAFMLRHVRDERLAKPAAPLANSNDFKRRCSPSRIDDIVQQ